MTNKERKSTAKYPCGACAEECKTNTIQCFACKIWFYQLCSGVPAQAITHIGRVKGLLWFCEPCLITQTEKPDCSPIIEKQVETISAQLNEVKAQLDNMAKENHSLNQPQSVQTEITKRSIRVTGIESTEENVHHRKADDMKKLKDVASKLVFLNSRLTALSALESLMNNVIE